MSTIFIFFGIGSHIFDIIVQTVVWSIIILFIPFVIALIKKEDWEYIELKKFDDNTFEYYFNSFTEREIKETNEKIYSILGIENGVNINYFFKIVNGKWYLVKIENLTT